MAEVNKLYLKIGTKAQYTANKASLAEPAKTLALTPLASEFSSNTTAGKGQFGVSGVTITTLTGTVGSNTAGAQKPVYLNSGTITALSTTTGGDSNPVYMSSGAITACKTPVSGTWFQGVPSVTSGGVMEIGRYVDFHPTSASTIDYGVRLDSGTSTNKRTFTFPAGTDGGSYTIMTTADFKDQNTTTGTAYPIYMATDSTAGAITAINMSTARLLFNPGTRKFTIMSTANETDKFTFGVQKVSSW